jgi:hypothetical protein
MVIELTLDRVEFMVLLLTILAILLAFFYVLPSFHTITDLILSILIVAIGVTALVITYITIHKY